MTVDVAVLQELTGLSAQYAWACFLVFLRVGTAMSLLPLFGERLIPQRIRLLVALCFTAIIAPIAMTQPAAEQAPLWAACAEVIAGLFLGLALRLFVVALQMAGAMIAQSTSLSQLFAGVGPEPQPAIGNLLVIAGFGIAVANGLAIKTVAYFVMSYRMLPFGTLPFVPDLTQWGVSLIASAFVLAVKLSAPFAIAALLYNIMLGVINRTMPSLMVSYIGAPALAGGGLALLLMCVPLLLSLWQQEYFRFLETAK